MNVHAPRAARLQRYCIAQTHPAQTGPPFFAVLAKKIRIPPTTNVSRSGASQRVGILPAFYACFPLLLLPMIILSMPARGRAGIRSSVRRSRGRSGEGSWSAVGL